MIIQTDEIVFTGPMWVRAMFQGMVNAKGTARIEIPLDPYGRPVVDKALFTDPSWNTDIDVVHPDTHESRKLIAWLEEMYRCVNEEEE
jgi:hypothetical protein